MTDTTQVPAQTPAANANPAGLVARVRAKLSDLWARLRGATTLDDKALDAIAAERASVDAVKGNRAGWLATATLAVLAFVAGFVGGHRIAMRGVTALERDNAALTRRLDAADKAAAAANAEASTASEAAKLAAAGAREAHAALDAYVRAHPDAPTAVKVMPAARAKRTSAAAGLAAPSSSWSWP